MQCLESVVLSVVQGCRSLLCLAKGERLGKSDISAPPDIGFLFVPIPRVF